MPIEESSPGGLSEPDGAMLSYMVHWIFLQYTFASYAATDNTKSSSLPRTALSHLCLW